MITVRKFLAVVSLFLGVALATFAHGAELLLVGTTPYGDGNPYHVETGGIALFDTTSYASVGPPIQALAPKTLLRGPVSGNVYVVSGGAVLAGLTPSLQILSPLTGEVISDVAFETQAGSTFVSLAMAPDESAIYLADSSSNLWRLELDGTGLVQRILPTTHAQSLSMSPDGRSLYLAYGFLQVADARDMSLHSLPYDARAAALVISRDGTRLYVINTYDAGSISCGPSCTVPGNSVWVVDIPSGAIVAKLNNVGTRPFAGILSPDGRYLYVANGDPSASYQNRGYSVTVISTETHTVIANFPSGGRAAGLAMDPAGTRLFVSTPGDNFDRIANLVAVFDARTGQLLRTIPNAQAPGALMVLQTTDSAFLPVTVVEYYHQGLDHYFMTPNTAEMADLDTGVHTGWQRTGRSFRAYRGGSGRLTPICRFYGLPSARLDSHFYSADPAECDRVATQFAGAWMKETDAAFELAVPSATGACAAGMIPVYRLWNQRSDSNHRYTTDPAVRDAMLAQGYVAEGAGAGRVTMCAPQ
jgi:DNA-binding beta-propeller fold protein YncE